MPKRKAKPRSSGVISASGKRYKSGTTGSKLVRQAQTLAQRLPMKRQGALPVATRKPNHLRHVAEYLRRLRENEALETSYGKNRQVPPRVRDRREHARLLKECERRKARREVLHAKGHAGSKKRYQERRPAGRTIDCKKLRH